MDAPIAVRTAGWIDRRPWHSTAGTRQGDVMLTVFLAGRGRYRNSRGAWEITAGMVGLVPPVDPGLLTADPLDPYLHWYCRFNGTYARHLVERILAARNGRRFVVQSDLGAIAERLRVIPVVHRGDLPDLLGRIELQVAELLLLLLGGATPPESLAFTERTLIDHLRRQLDQPTDLTAIAGHFAVSVRTLSRRCRDWTGCSVQVLHERMKMAWAHTLLATTDDAIAGIARRTGYRDPAYFSRIYHRHFGHPPSLDRTGGRWG